MYTEASLFNFTYEKGQRRKKLGRNELKLMWLFDWWKCPRFLLFFFSWTKLLLWKEVWRKQLQSLQVSNYNVVREHMKTDKKNIYDARSESTKNTIIEILNTISNNNWKGPCTWGEVRFLIWTGWEIDSRDLFSLWSNEERGKQKK